MKRIISLILTFCVIMSFMSYGVFAEPITFSDLAEEHWAYENIMTLVEKGTINGYEDATFRPERTVTRAEFVKMIGKWDQKTDETYEDLSEEHWGYEYIIWSGLEADGTRIRPDEAITRSEVINLIWKRNGSPKHNLAPGAISRQGTNADAASWAYTIGLMKGDDGLNLRLESSLTRAEAATLIVRSNELVAKNEKYSFVDVVSEELLKTTFESLALSEGKKYDANKTLTYGEIARMTVAFGADGRDITFSNTDLINSKNKAFKSLNHEYDNEMFILSSKVWGDDYYTKKKIDQPATKQDTISAIMYGFTRRATTPVTVGKKDAYYPDCKNAKSTSWENLYLTYANQNGIRIRAKAELGAEETITIKEYSAFLLLFNEAIGLGVAYTDDGKTNAKINTNMTNLPYNYMDFEHTIDGAPVGLYRLKNDGVSAEKDYKSFNLLGSTYFGYLSEVSALAKKNTGYTLTETFYPALSYKQNGNVVFAAKFKVSNENNDAQILVDKLLADVINEPTGYTVGNNSEFYVVFETDGPLMDIYLPYSGASVKAVFVN